MRNILFLRYVDGILAEPRRDVTLWRIRDEMEEQGIIVDVVAEFYIILAIIFYACCACEPHLVSIAIGIKDINAQTSFLRVLHVKRQVGIFERYFLDPVKELCLALRNIAGIFC